ncbi:MAG: restriction endonuclease subunit S [Flavobacterium sp.]
MKGYNNYKKSKFIWFDKLPENWVEGKIKYLFKISRGRVISQLELKSEAKYPVYSSQTKNNGCLGYIDTFDYEGEMLTWTTDGANAGSVFQRKGKFNCTNVCGILIPKQKLELRYYYYYIAFITQFYKRPDTNGAKIMSNEMAEIHCFIPSLEEQKKIAYFLDYKTNIIDSTIEKKKNLIKLLKEKRQAVINDAVTKGSNSEVRMKESGLKWLGQIPANWDLVPIRYINNKIGSGVTPKGGGDVYTDEGITFIRSQNVHFDGLRLDDVVKIDIETHKNMNNSIVQRNDVLLNITGASIGRCCVVDRIEEMNINQHVCIIRVNEKIIPAFLNIVLQSNVGQTQIKLLTTGGNREGLTQEAVKNITIPLPDIKTQMELLESISEKLNIYNLIHVKISNSIEKLEIYRQSLISEAVTGKIDIRDWKQKK